MIFIRVIGEKWNLISAAIRFETRCWASHVELVRVDDSNYDKVIDVLACRWPRGLRHYPYITKNVTREEWYTAPNLNLVWEWMAANVGQKYDLSAIFGIALDEDFHVDDRDICSESLVRGSEWAATQIMIRQKSNTFRANAGENVLYSLEGDFSNKSWLNLTSVSPWRVTPRDLLMSQSLTRVRRIK